MIDFADVKQISTRNKYLSILSIKKRQASDQQSKFEKKETL